jgi:starch synthase
MTPFSPANDKAIARAYGVQTLEYKVQNKTALQEEIGWVLEPKRAVLCVPCGVSEQLGGKLLEDLLPGLLEMPVQILILGKGSASYGKMLTEIAKEHSDRIAIVPNDEKSIRKMYAASDMGLFLTNPAALPELQQSLAYGVIPIAPSVSKLHDYNPNQESGEAFVYEKANAWHVFAGIVRALETFKFPFDWRTIQRHCMEMSERR